MDLFIGESGGNINFFCNDGTPENPKFPATPTIENFPSIDVGNNSAPVFADIDNDGDLDLFVGERDGNIIFFCNDGTPEDSKFSSGPTEENFASIHVGFNSNPVFADIDDDGDLDLFIGEGAGNINFVRNNGTPKDPKFSSSPTEENFASIHVDSISVPVFVDMDNDGDLDVFVGTEAGGLVFYCNLSVPPTVITNPVADVSVDTVKLTGSINPNGLTATSYFVVYSSTTDYKDTVKAQPSSITGIIDTEVSAALIVTDTTISPCQEYHYKLIASNSVGSSEGDDHTFTTLLPNYDGSLNVNHSFTFTNRPNPKDYQPTEYQIIGIPGGSDMSVADFLSGNHRSDWQAYRDNGDTSTNPTEYLDEFDGTAKFQFSGGRAFWIIHKGDIIISKTVATVPLNDSLEADIPLHEGFNLITSPFDSPIAWSTIIQANNDSGAIFSYNGTSFLQAINFEPYVGYYFKKPTNLDTLKIPYKLVFTAPPVTENIDIAKWRVTINLASNHFNDNTTSFGVTATASSGQDGFDFHKPRAIAQMPTVSFQRPRWDAKYSTFITDIRPEIADSSVWEFEVRAIPGVNATLSFSGIRKIPAHLEAYLTDVTHVVLKRCQKCYLYRYGKIIRSLYRLSSCNIP